MAVTGWVLPYPAASVLMLSRSSVRVPVNPSSVVTSFSWGSRDKIVSMSLFVAVHLLFLGDDLRLTADDDLSQHIGAVVQEAIPLKLPHGGAWRIGVGREITHLADLLVVLVEDDIDREHGVRIRH